MWLTRVSYSSTKLSFPFLLHTSPVCYFWAMFAELIVSSRSHTHAKHAHVHTHTHYTTCKTHWECFSGDVHLLWCTGTIADSVEQTEISRVTRKVKNIILHKMVKGPDHVNATVALSYKGMHTHSHIHKFRLTHRQWCPNSVLQAGGQRQAGVEKLELRQSADSGNKPVRERDRVCVCQRERCVCEREGERRTLCYTEAAHECKPERPTTLCTFHCFTFYL